MKNILLTIAISIIAVGACKNKDANDAFEMNHEMNTNALMQSMKSTTEMMNNSKMNGDFDYDFANLMIMHHQMAIDMSQVEIQEGADQSIVDMAAGIVAAQEIEIKMMQEFIKKYKIQATNNQTSNSYKIATEMKTMMNQMERVKMTQNVDKDYVAMMIPHHQSAVNMAKTQLQYGKQEVLFELSKNIIEDQNYEIEVFKQWQTKN
jgi:uncharacterized protein (DUF305 family)